MQTLEYHQHNVACVSFLGDRPLILSGSEDGSVVLWNSTTYRNESVLNYNLERCWSSAYIKSMNRIALGYDLGTSQTTDQPKGEGGAKLTSCVDEQRNRLTLGLLVFRLSCFCLLLSNSLRWERAL